MIIIIAGATHTGKTYLAQKLLEKYHYPYFSIDHLKMGLIRSNHTSLTPYSSEEDLTNLLWPIVKEMIKTAIENKQNLIVEGCYVPYDAMNNFEPSYQQEIKIIRLIMSKKYINTHYNEIIKYANIIENRIDDSDCTKESLINDNNQALLKCQQCGVDYYLIDDHYNITLDI